MSINALKKLPHSKNGSSSQNPSIQREAGGIPSDLKRILKRYEFTQSQLASKIGISSGALTQILNGEYELQPDSFVLNQIKKFLDRADQKIYDTKLLKTVFKMLKSSFDEKEIAVITSTSGAGKTTAVYQFCLFNHNAIHIRVNEVMTTKYLLATILKSLAVNTLGMNKQIMFESLTDLLERKNRLIVIDEAERLAVSQLEVLRDLYDQGNIGLCLIGLDALTTLLKRGRNMRENLVQLYSRVTYRNVVNILEPSDVRMVLNDKLRDHSVSDQKISELSKTFRDKGGLRAIIKICNLAEKFAAVNEIDVIDDDLIIYCIQEYSFN